MAERGHVVPDDGHVPTGGPRLPFASPDDGAHFGMALEFGQYLEEPCVHVVVERIALLGIVVGDHGNAAVQLEKNLVRHAIPSFIGCGPSAVTLIRSALVLAKTRNGWSLSVRGSLGKPRTRSPRALRWMLSVPPPSRDDHWFKNAVSQIPSSSAAPSADHSVGAEQLHEQVPRETHVPGDEQFGGRRLGTGRAPPRKGRLDAVIHEPEELQTRVEIGQVLADERVGAPAASPSQVHDLPDR